jgi:hypothetical protein
MSSNNDSQRVIWGSLPDWISEISKEGGIYRYVLLVMVSAVLAFFEATAGFLYRTMYWLFVYPVRMVFDTIAGVSRPFWMLLDWTAGFQATIEAAASSAGLTGPLVALAGWLVPAILIIGILNVVLGFAETYLPLSAIPILGRWFG